MSYLFIFVVSFLFGKYYQKKNMSFQLNKQEAYTTKLQAIIRKLSEEHRIVLDNLEHSSSEVNIKEKFLRSLTEENILLKHEIKSLKNKISGYNEVSNILYERIHSHRLSLRTHEHMASKEVVDKIAPFYSHIKALLTLQKELDEFIPLAEQKFHEISSNNYKEQALQEQSIKSGVINNYTGEVFISWSTPVSDQSFRDWKILETHRDALAYIFQKIDVLKAIVLPEESKVIKYFCKDKIDN